jgi:hypothetical protein
VALPKYRDAPRSITLLDRCAVSPSAATLCNAAFLPTFFEMMALPRRAIK